MPHVMMYVSDWRITNAAASALTLPVCLQLKNLHLGSHWVVQLFLAHALLELQACGEARAIYEVRLSPVGWEHRRCSKRLVTHCRRCIPLTTGAAVRGPVPNQSLHSNTNGTVPVLPTRCGSCPRNVPAVHRPG